MIERSGCLSRKIGAIASDALFVQRFSRGALALTPRVTNRTPCRRNTTATTSVTALESTREVPFLLKGNRPRDGEINGAPKELTAKQARKLQMELQYLTDPVKFADHVHVLLRSDHSKRAFDMCRVASKRMDCVVAWNHIINWLMMKGRRNEAISVYNEMKKRAQFPDSYTYLLLLRGFPMHRTHHEAPIKKELIAKALSIYQSMSSETSRVKPAIIHTNAMLRLCSLAHDMDTLWEVVSQLPEDGPSSADHVTYTILLSAIRHAANSEEMGISPEKIARIRQRAVNEGRRVWQDIINRWRGGEILIDEELVCEMGNLLLVSKSIDDWDDVLNLVQQTTNIQRLLPPLGTPGRRIEHVPTSRRVVPGDGPIDPQDDEGWSPTPANDAFRSVEPHLSDADKPRRPRSLAWVQPGNAILSIITDACTLMRAPKGLTAYWDTIKLRGVLPDQANYQALLRFLRTNRNSAKAAAVLRDMHQEGVELRNATFRIALSVCARNLKNPNVLDHAGAIVDLMYQHQDQPDIPTLETYLDLGIRIKDGLQISVILEKVQSTIHSLVALAKGEGKFYPTDGNSIISFFPRVIGAIDVFGRDGTVPIKDVERWKTKRSELDAILLDVVANSATRTQQRQRFLESMKSRNDTARSTNSAHGRTGTSKFRERPASGR